MRSKFYRLYNDGDKKLIIAKNTCDALHLAGFEVDEKAEYVRLVQVDEKMVTMEEVRECAIISYNDKKVK